MTSLDLHQLSLSFLLLLLFLVPAFLFFTFLLKHVGQDKLHDELQSQNPLTLAVFPFHLLRREVLSIHAADTKGTVQVFGNVVVGGTDI